MNKKYILIVVAVILIIILIACLKNSKSAKNEVSNNVTDASGKNINYYYNEISGTYYIVDSNTGEVLFSDYDEDSVKLNLDFYKQNPDYRADPPASPNSEVENSVD